MTDRRRGSLTIASLFIAFLAAAVPIASAPSLAQNLGPDFGARGDDNKGSIELIDPKTLRVCADPNNLPFSNEAGEGFENKIAELLAAKLGKSLAYTYYPGASGFVRNTLNAHLCDVVLGMPQGNDLVQTTNPYYRTTYAVVSRAGADLDRLASLADPRLKEKGRRIGLVANTPPGNVLAAQGLLGSVKPYPLMIDTRFDSSSAAMIKDLQAGEIDIGLLWGPIAGFYAHKSNGALDVMPLADAAGARMSFRICFGVRHSDQEWKRELNQFLEANRGALNRILLDFGVPLIDEAGKPILVEEPAAKDAGVAGNGAPAARTEPPKADQPPKSVEAQKSVEAPPPVEEPKAYRAEPLHGPTPKTLAGATVLDTAQAFALWEKKSAVFVDALSRPHRPEGLAPGTVWRYPTRRDIPASIWLPDTGYADLSPDAQRYFETALSRATHGDKNAMLVFYCRKDCWASWNAGKRALSLGYTKVAWYPDGVDGWEQGGHPLEERQPEWRSPTQ